MNHSPAGGPVFNIDTQAKTVHACTHISTHAHKHARTHTYREHPKTVHLHSFSVSLSILVRLSTAHTEPASCSGRAGGPTIPELQGHQTTPADIPHLSPPHSDSHSGASEWEHAGGDWQSQVPDWRSGHRKVQWERRDRQTGQADRQIAYSVTSKHIIS